MKEVKLPSGAKLEVGAADFATSRKLFKSVASEIKDVNFKDDLKNLFVGMLSSDEVEEAVHCCFSRCLYNGEKLTVDIFEEEKAREDYLPVLIEVGTSNLSPFLKSLYAEFEKAIQLVSTPQV